MSLSLDKKHILSKIGQTNSLHELESVRLEYLGKKGIIPSEMKSLRQGSGGRQLLELLFGGLR